MARRMKYTKARFRRERALWRLLIKKTAEPGARQQQKRSRQSYAFNSNLESFAARWARAA